MTQEETQQQWELETKDLSTDEKFQKIQAIFDMHARGITSYMNGTPEEIDAVERHRAASPYEVGNEPDYDKPFQRLPRKKKKELKKWIVKHNVRPSLPPSYVWGRFKDKRKIREIYYSMWWMKSNIETGNNIKELKIED